MENQQPESFEFDRTMMVMRISAVAVLVIIYLVLRQNYDGGFFAIVFALVAVGACVYFLPTLKAYSVGHVNRAAIFVLNLLLGWLLIPWVIALVWSYKKSAGAVVHAPSNDVAQGEFKKCPYCAEEIRIEAIKCRYCHSDVD